MIDRGCVARGNTVRGDQTEMGRQIAGVIYVVAMAAVILGVDFMFFRNQFWERLTVNIGIVLVFLAFLLEVLQEFLNKARESRLSGAARVRVEEIVTARIVIFEQGWDGIGELQMHEVFVRVFVLSTLHLSHSGRLCTLQNQ